MSSQVMMNSAFMANRGMLGAAPAGLGVAPAPYDGAFFPYQRNATVVDNVPHDILHMIHEHWYQFPPMNPLWHSLLGMAMIVLGIVSVIGNGMVVYLMSTTKVNKEIYDSNQLNFSYPFPA